jgi:hypothetical protein
LITFSLNQLSQILSILTLIIKIKICCSIHLHNGLAVLISAHLFACKDSLSVTLAVADLLSVGLYFDTELTHLVGS